VAPGSASRMNTVSAGLLRWGLFLLVLWYVVVQAKTLWQNSRSIDISVDWKYVVAAGLISQLSWLPSTWFWHRLIVLLGGKSDAYPLIRAYYCGSLGKYMPGKAAVILIRSAMLKQQQVSFVRASIASMVEAGAVMLVGSVVSLAFALTIIPPDALPGWVSQALPRQSTSWSGLLLLVAVLIATTPYIAVPANWLLQEFSRMIEQRARKKEASNSSTARTTDRSNEPINVPTDSVVPRLTWQFLTTASLMFALSWAGHGLSLLFVLRSLNPQMLSLDNWTIATAAAAAGTSIGFFAIFAPGGLAVREGLIISVLAPSTGGAIAVADASPLSRCTLSRRELTTHHLQARKSELRLTMTR
jgi:glycosyltransferase 2 family protein